MVRERERQDFSRRIVWKPNPGPQTALLACPVFEIFYGGARGGGKSDGMIGDWMAHSSKYGRAARGIFVRREAKQLEELIRRSSELLGQLGARFNGSRSTFTMRNGATLKFRHLWNEDAAGSYLGHAYTRLYAEEITEWGDMLALRKMMGTLRSAEGAHCGFRATGNPGGRGHAWVKARYVSPSPSGYKPIFDEEMGEYRIFIPAKLEDNPALMLNDPNYERRLRGSGPEALVKAWRWGLWDIVVGAYFQDVLAEDGRQIIPPFEIPKTWQWIRAFDWGSSHPACLLHLAVSDGTAAPNGRIYPRGSIFLAEEMYTVKYGADGIVEPNVGLRLTNPKMGELVARMARGRRFLRSVADPACFSENGGPSIAAQMRQGDPTTVFSPADNERVSGWQIIRQLLSESKKDMPEKPGLWIFNSCRESVRTIPVLQISRLNSEDIDTDAEDHAADALRYGVKSIIMQGMRGGWAP